MPLSGDAEREYRARYRKTHPEYVERERERVKRNAPAKRQSNRAYSKRGTSPDGPNCTGCGWRMLEASESGMCGFCLEERALKESA